MNTGIEYYNSGDYEAAIKQFEEAIKLQPDEEDAYVKLGMAYLMIGNVEKAQETWEEGYRITKNNRFRELIRDHIENSNKKNDNSQSARPDNSSSLAENKSQNEAEIIAEMIVENEKTWHKTDRLDDMYKEIDLTMFDIPATNCWFEDLDFDGKKEFVVGPVHISPGQTLSCSFDIYDIIDGKLNKRINTNNPNDNNSSFEFYKENQLSDMNCKTNNIGMFIYKRNDGKYHYSYLGFTMYSITENLVICDYDFRSFTSTAQYQYQFSMDETTPEKYAIGSNEYSQSEMINKLKLEMNTSKQCTVNSKPVALTNKIGQVTADCYSKKTKEEKIKMLVESYNSYKIVESDQKPDFLEYMLKNLEKKMPKPVDTSKLSDDEKQYKEILDKYKKDITEGLVYANGYEPKKDNEVGYALYDLDNDGHKELLIIQGDGTEKSGVIFDIYSIVDNKPKEIISSKFIASQISIAQDNSIVLYERFSTNEGWYDKYNSLITLLSSGNPNERLVYEPDYNIGMPTYKYSVGGNEKTISGDEFQSIVKKWTNNAKTFDIKLFSEYA